MRDDAPSSPVEVTPWVRKLVRLMDDAIEIPGTRYRIGWDAILGLLLPGAGDAIGALSQVALFIAAVRAGAPRTLLARMLLNVAADAIAGSVPVLGDLFDAGFKANRRNLELVERLQQPSAAPRRSRAADLAILAGIVVGLLALMSLPIVLALYLFSKLG